MSVFKALWTASGGYVLVGSSGVARAFTVRLPAGGISALGSGCPALVPTFFPDPITRPAQQL
jgi:hypothetical protein